MIKKTAVMLATVSMGFMSLAACGDDDKGASPPASPASSASGAPTTAPPTAPDPGGSSAPTPDAPASGAPEAGGSDVIMIDPTGKKFTRSEMVRLAAGMAASMGSKSFPPDFCAKSYQAGIKGGGKFPAGRQAFMDACAEGVRSAG